jgi:hypothetical protein
MLPLVRLFGFRTQRREDAKTQKEDKGPLEKFFTDLHPAFRNRPKEISEGGDKTEGSDDLA